MADTETCWITINIVDDPRAFRRSISGLGCINKAKDLCVEIGNNGYFNSSLNTKNVNTKEIITYFPPYKIDNIIIEVIESKNGK